MRQDRPTSIDCVFQWSALYYNHVAFCYFSYLDYKFVEKAKYVHNELFVPSFKHVLLSLLVQKGYRHLGVGYTIMQNIIVLFI